MSRHRSLRWRITFGLVAFQIVTLVAVSTFMASMALNASPDGVLVNPSTLHTVAQSLGRDDEGRLTLYPSAELSDMQARFPNLWYVATSSGGERISFGAVPLAASEIMQAAPVIKSVDLRGSDADPSITARFEYVTVPMGRFAIMLGGGGFISDFEASVVVGNFLVLGPTLILVVLTLIGIPLFIRFCLRTVTQLPKRMEKIDFQSRGVRLSTDGLPKEIAPVFEGMNEALRRIDAGFEVTERFFMNAAHELRTPIAILQVRLDALPEAVERDKLQAVVRRLTVLVNQLLDLERFRQNQLAEDYVELGAVLSEAAADLAPYAVSEGYELSLEKTDRQVWVRGDKQSLDRLAMNLIQNAIQHGGRSGAIVVRLDDQGTIEVQDQGPGVPPNSREKIFEPFFRVNPHGAGAGLGLKMVRDIARAHGGEASIGESSIYGTTFRVRIPVRAISEVHTAIRDGRFLTPVEP